MNSEKKHQKVARKQKAAVDQSIAAAEKDQSVVVLLTGDGKGKTTSAFGMIMRALGYGQKVAVIQFIKGEQLSGEELYLRDKLPDVEFHQMGTGFTWDTQNRELDIAAAKKTWAVAQRLLADVDIDLVVLDELTYMLGFKYLDEEEVVAAIRNRPDKQSVIVTGRGGGSKLRDIADTVSEVQAVKHAFNNKIKARQGVDY